MASGDDGRRASLRSITDELYDEATAEDRSWVAGKVVCVSGATGAMGKALVRALCELRGSAARLLLAARTQLRRTRCATRWRRPAWCARYSLRT